MFQFGVLQKKMNGSVQVEQLVLLAMVAVSFAAAAIGLGPTLFQYHRGIEWILSLPVP